MNYLTFVSKNKLICNLNNCRHAELCVLLNTPILVNETYSTVCKLWDRANFLFCYLVCILVTKGYFFQMKIKWTTSDIHTMHLQCTWVHIFWMGYYTVLTNNFRNTYVNVEKCTCIHWKALNMQFNYVK